MTVPPMFDRRAATTLGRMLDPEHAFLQAAVRSLYAEVEPDAVVAFVNIAVMNSDGTLTMYGVSRHDANAVHSGVVTDPDAVANGVEAGIVQTTVDVDG